MKLFLNVVYLCCATVLVLLCLSGNAEASEKDKFSLSVMMGKPAVVPNIASVNESVTFNYSISLCDSNGTHVEEIPATLKEILYGVRKMSGTISRCNPVLNISADKHSAAKTIKQLCPNASVEAVFSQAGNFSCEFMVVVTFNDNSQLQKSCSIPLEVVDATLTVYAKDPQIKVMFSQVLGIEIPHCVGEPGHSFWKIECFASAGFLTDTEAGVAGNSYGHYPATRFPGDKRAVKLMKGKIQCDNIHPRDASMSFKIKVTDAKKALKETSELLNRTNLRYHLINTLAKNCTGQCVRVSNSFAKAKTPKGIGVIGYVGSIEDTTGYYDPFPFSNPYHHVREINDVQKR